MPRIVLSSVFALFVVQACAPASSTSNKPLAVCDEGSDGCPSVPRAEKQPAPSRATGPSGDPSTPSTSEDDLTEANGEDAGTGSGDAAADAALGTLCTALAKCCVVIEQSGYLPDNCNSVVALQHENACYAQHQQYKNAGDC